MDEVNQINSIITSAFEARHHMFLARKIVLEKDCERVTSDIHSQKAFYIYQQSELSREYLKIPYFLKLISDNKDTVEASLNVFWEDPSIKNSILSNNGKDFIKDFANATYLIDVLDFIKERITQLNNEIESRGAIHNPQPQNTFGNKLTYQFTGGKKPVLQVLVLWRELLNKGYIAKISFANFHQIFKGVEIKKIQTPIIWLKSATELLYLIKNLQDNELLERKYNSRGGEFQDYQVLKYCFRKRDNTTFTETFKNIRISELAKEKQKNIDVIIQSLEDTSLLTSLQGDE